MALRNLGDYTILKQIGQGSLGTVYLAEHKFMKKQYAIKVLPEELAQDKGFIQRFEEDVARMAALDHPHIVKLHNISYVEGCYFLVMDCVVDALGETTNFSQYMTEQSNPLLEEDLKRWLYQIASALDYAHSKPTGQAIVHRGLKLNNILIGRNDQDEIDLYIADFGLSKIIGIGAVLSRIYQSVARSLEVTPFVKNSATGEEQYPSSSQESRQLKSVHNSFLQSYAFLAPEQKNPSESTDVSLKCDTYAFGVLAYYAITKKFPEGVFEMPSYFMPQYRKNWDLLITKCLQADPEKRPKSLVEALDELLETTATPLTKAIEKIEASIEKKVVEDKFENVFEETPVLNQKVATVASNPINQTPRATPMMSTVSKPETNLRTETKRLKPVIQQGEIKRPVYDPDPGSIFSLDTTVTHYQPKKETHNRNVTPILTDMVVINGGSYYRGSKDGNRDEMPMHKVQLKNFAIDVHPITNEQFMRFLEAMGGEKDAQNNDIIRLKESRLKRSGGQLSIESGYAKHPVVGVSWYGAVAYTKWIGKRLPTEAEWEIAARAADEGMYYPTGSEIEKNQANFFGSDTTAVMSYPANTIGLYDMAGNVYEWCQDWYGYNYYDASSQEPDQPRGPHQGVYRVLRGGCWKSLKDDLRCSHRHRNNPGCENRTYGFRCATDTE